MAQRNMRQRRSAAQWTTLVEEWERSGLTQRAFCQEHGLALATFGKWRTQIQRQPAFVEMDQPEPASLPGWDIELALGDGLTLRLRRP